MRAPGQPSKPFHHLLSTSLVVSIDGARPARQTFSPSPLCATGHIQRQRQASNKPHHHLLSASLAVSRDSARPANFLSAHQIFSPSPRRSYFHLRCRGTKHFHHLLVGAIFTSLVEAPNLITISSSELFSPLLSRHQTLSPSPRRSYFHVPCRDTKPYHHLLSGPGQGPRMELEEIWKRFAF